MGLNAYRALFATTGHIAGALGMMGNWNLHSFESELSRLETPIRLVYAENDRAVPPGQALRIHARLPRASLVKLPRLGHLAHEEAPRAVTDIILAPFT